MMLPWWKKWPDRLDFELNALKQADILYEIDQEAYVYGVVKLNAEFQINGFKQKLIIIYPDTYPYMRFEIFAPELRLHHHQNPFEKNLCLIGRSTKNWLPSDTAANFIKNRLPLVIESGTGFDPEKVEEMEEHQGEPISDYYTYAPNGIILIDSSWSIDSNYEGGYLSLGSSSSAPNEFNMAVVKIMDKEKNILAEPDPSIAALHKFLIPGRWIRIHEPIVEKDPALILDNLRSINPNLLKHMQKMQLGKYVIGILFPEELKWRTTKDSWLFLFIDTKGRYN